jgi:hypothetical protein
MQAAIESLVTGYRSGKQYLSVITGASEDLLHVHAGLLIFVLSALILRKKMRSPIPLALVVFFATLNEVVDWYSGAPQAPFEHYIDFANTVFWPAVLFLLARRWR